MEHAYVDWIWLRDSLSFVIILFRPALLQILPVLVSHNGVALFTYSVFFVHLIGGHKAGLKGYLNQQMKDVSHLAKPRSGAPG